MSDYSEVAARVQAAVEQPAAPVESKQEPAKQERKPLGLPKKEEPAPAPEPPREEKPDTESQETPDTESQETSDTESQEKPDNSRQKMVEEATEKGWMPKEEWVKAGKDPDDWVSSKKFLEESRRIEQWRTIKKDFERLSKQNDLMAETIRKGFGRQTQKELKEKLALRDKAIELGDKETVYQIEREIQEEQAAMQSEQKSSGPEIHPDIDAFVKENREWWGVDPIATDGASRYYGRLEAENPDDVAGNLEKTKKWVKKRFPDLFSVDVDNVSEAAVAVNQQQSSQRKLSSVSAPTGGNAPPNKSKQWSDLPPETRKVADQLVRKGVMTRDDYLKTYQW